MIFALGLAAQLAIVSHAPDTVAACDPVEVTVAVRVPGTTVPQLLPPSFSPFDVLRSSPAPQVTIESGGAGAALLAEYRFILATDQAGLHVLPPFEARFRGQTARSEPLRILVRPGTARVPQVVARARVDTSLEVNFRALTQPETVYVGQQANYEVAVFLNENVRERLRRNPTFFPPDIQSMLAYDLPSSGNPPRRQIGSRCFDALVYQRALFPLLPGRFVIPPAQLVYALPVSSSFFSREETRELQTDSAVVVAIDPPAAGRPADYAGAVGRLRLSARVDTTLGRVGSPMTLTLRVDGTGNVRLFPRPEVRVPWGSLVKGDERVTVDSGSPRIAGSKEFDWVLTPTRPGELDLPAISYPYFNPATRQYERATTDPRRMRIAPGMLASADTARTDPALALRTRFRGPLRPPLSEQPVFWLLLAIAPLPALGLRARSRRREMPPTPASSQLQSLRNAGAAGTALDAPGVRRLFVQSLADRLHLSPEVFTRMGGLARALRRAGVSRETADEAEQFLRMLDEAAYARGGALPPDAGVRANALYARADAEALPRLEIPRAMRLGILLMAVVAGAGALEALGPDEAREAFDAGVIAYRADDMAAARIEFVRAVRLEPGAPDAWANLGTVAWAAHDTAGAVVGWQRALRLEPMATDLRDRLDLAHSSTIGSAGYVPPVTPTILLAAALTLWLAVWTLATIRARRQQPIVRSGATAAMVAAGFAVLAGLAIDERLSARRLGVVRDSGPLADLPSLGAERRVQALAGEVVQIQARQGAWARVLLDDDREGWIELRALRELDRRVVDTD